MTNDPMPENARHGANVVPYASNAPGRLGTPKPRTEPLVLPAGVRTMFRGTGIGGGGVVFLGVVSGSWNTCRGATRSAKLQWEQRQLEIDKVIALDSSCRQNEAEGE